MIRNLSLAVCLALSLAACDPGGPPVAPPAPVGFSTDLVRMQDWEIYYKGASRLAEVVAVVVDEDDRPYPGASVSLLLLPRMEVLTPTVIDTEITDENGRVRFEEVPGNALLRVDAEGFARILVDLRFAVNPDFGIPRIVLRQGAVVSGRVSLPDGTPVPGLRVLGVSAGHDWYGVGETDQEGRYQLPLVPEGEISLMVLPGGPLGQTPPFMVTAGRDLTRDLTVRVLPPIHGQVLDADTGEPVAGAVARSFIDRDVMVEADEEGRFTLSNVYGMLIEVFAPGYAMQSVPVNVTRTEADNLTVKLTPGVTARGRVVDDQGRPRVGARVFAVADVEKAGLYLRGPLTDDQGRFSWSWLDPAVAGGKIVFGADGAGLLPMAGASHPIVPGITIDDVVLTLPDPAVLRFRFVSEDGEPLVNVRCMAEPDLRDALPGVRPMINTVVATLTGEDGAGRMVGVMRGPHFLTVLPDDRFPFTTEINVGPGVNDLGDITVPKLLSIEGRVASTGGELPEMVKVFLSIPGETFQMDVRVGKDGSFRIGGLEDRRYVLQLAATDHRTITREFAAGTKDILVRLTHLGKISITPLLEGDVQPEGQIEMVRAGGADAPVMRFFNRPGETVEANRMTPGDWYVRVKAGEYYGMTKVTIAGGKSESVEVPLLHGGTIHGVVKEPDGSPARRIGVQYDAGEAWGVHGIETADDGQYRLIGVPAGEVKLLTHPRNFVPFSRTIEVKNGEDDRQDINLDAGGLFELLVTDPDGSPLDSVKVSLTDMEGAPASYWVADRAQTDEAGVLIMKGIPPGNYRLSLHIEKELWDSRQVEIPAGESKLVIEIDR